MELFLATPEDTDVIAGQLAELQSKPVLIWLQGDLGAGKSAFSRAYLRRLGVTGPIKSPTYTIAELYDLPDGKQAAHLDLYRLAGPDDLEFLGLPEREALHTVLIEWPEQGATALGIADVVIELAVQGQGRRARLLAQSPEAERWISTFASALDSVRREREPD